MVNERLNICFPAMGCKFRIWLEAVPAKQKYLERAADQIRDIEASLSRFLPDSELSRLNSQSGKWVGVSDNLLKNIIAAKQAAEQTDGLYNPLIWSAIRAAGYDRSFDRLEPAGHLPGPPTQVADWQRIEINEAQNMVRLPDGEGIDLGGISKGWTAAFVANQLKEHGACLVEAGGDIVAYGSPHHSEGWPVNVAEPGHSGETLLTIALKNLSVVTSGVDCRRWKLGNQWQHHIIDPRTGKPAATDVLSATVIHPRATIAEAYTKAVVIRGCMDGLAWLNEQAESAGLVVRHDGMVLATANFQPYIVQGALA